MKKIKIGKLSIWLHWGKNEVPRDQVRNDFRELLIKHSIGNEKHQYTGMTLNYKMTHPEKGYQQGGTMFIHQDF